MKLRKPPPPKPPSERTRREAIRMANCAASTPALDASFTMPATHLYGAAWDAVVELFELRSVLNADYAAMSAYWIRAEAESLLRSGWCPGDRVRRIAPPPIDSPHVAPSISYVTLELTLAHTRCPHDTDGDGNCPVHVNCSDGEKR